MKIKEITNFFDKLIPLSLQESYDNSGLIVGNLEQETKSVLITLDVTEDIIDEAIEKKSNLIIAHHPIIFTGLKKITGKNFIERTIIKAIKNDIAIYASYINLDNIKGGVNSKICNKLSLINTKILASKNGDLRKLVTFVPKTHIEKVRKALFSVGVGSIGNYSSCSFNIEGEGTFLPSDNTNPYLGEKLKLNFEKEIRFETIFSKHIKPSVIATLLKNHPYEEVAYDIYPLDNTNDNIGLGMIGEFNEPISEIELLEKLKQIFGIKAIKHTKLFNKKIRKVAVCGGSGSFLLNRAIALEADVFISSDFKYHQFFDAENKILITDIGHFESEQFTKEIFYEILSKKFPKFAVYLSKINTNPIYYYM